MRKLKSKIIETGDFNYISFSWSEDGSCDIIVAKNDGKAFKARGKRDEKGKLIILDDQEIDW